MDTNASTAQGLRVLLVEDHPIFADAMTTALAGLQRFEVVDHETSLAGARERLAADDAYHLVLLDLHLDDASGHDALLELRETHPDIPIIVVSGSEDAHTIRTAFEQGVRGYIPKTSPRSVMVHAISMVMDGSSYIPPHALSELAGTPRQAAPMAEAPSPALQEPKLSPRQQEVLHYLLQGMPNKVIAARLGMAEGTVKTHLNTIYRLFGANNRAQVILRAGQLGML